jgi:hypothetical protein
VFIGHAALGFAAKPAAPRASLAWLLVAPWLLDIPWPIFLMLGIERVSIVPGATAFTPLDFSWYPWSHSLAMSIVWAVLLALLYRARTGDRRGAAIIGALVVSHWLLDLIVHRPDLPIAPGLATRVGLGLWNRPTATLVVEGALFALGLSVYLVATRAQDRRGVIGLWSLVVFIVGIYVSSVLGPPPPSASAIAPVTLVFGIVIAPWAFWVDRHRVMRREAAG